MDKQRTIDRVVKARGIGIYSGNIVDVALFPAPDSHGIVIYDSSLRYVGKDFSQDW